MSSATIKAVRPSARAAVDHVFGAGDGAGARRDEEGDEVRHLPRLRRSPERDAAERPHDDLLAALVVGAGLLGQPFGQGDGGFGFDPAGRDAHDADPLRRHLLRQALAVGRQRRLRRGIGGRRFRQRQLVLDRRDVNDHAGALLDHRRQQRAIEADGRHQVLVELLRHSLSSSAANPPPERSSRPAR